MQKADELDKSFMGLLFDLSYLLVWEERLRGANAATPMPTNYANAN